MMGLAQHCRRRRRRHVLDPNPPMSVFCAERGKSLVKHLESDDITAISAILLPPGYRLREGAKLPWDGVRVGKMLGSGMQVCACLQRTASCCFMCSFLNRWRRY